jgi:hypothetical protein
VTITYEIDDGTDVTEGSVKTNLSGNYMITAPSGSTIKIINVEKDGYHIDPAPFPLTPAALQNFTMTYDVEVAQTSTAPIVTPESDTRVKVEVELKVTNYRETTVVLFAGSGWSLPSFGGLSYVVIPAGSSATPSTTTVTMVAYYNPQEVGAGNENLSVLVKDLSGDVLHTEVLDTYTMIGVTTEGLKVAAEGNRVSKHEYGFAVTFTNTTDKWIKLNLSAVYDATAAHGWFVSIVDENNMIIDPTDDIKLNGNSTAVYYVRLINEGAVSESLSLPKEISMQYTSSATDKIELNIEPTILSAGDMNAEGNNIFGSPAGMPTIVWVFAALCILMMLLVFWLGLRRGVFLRKR